MSSQLMTLLLKSTRVDIFCHLHVQTLTDTQDLANSKCLLMQWINPSEAQSGHSSFHLHLFQVHPWSSLGAPSSQPLTLAIFPANEAETWLVFLPYGDKVNLGPSQ